MFQAWEAGGRGGETGVKATVRGSLDSASVFSNFYYLFLKDFIFKSSLHPTWGPSSQPQDQESHAPATEPAGRPDFLVQSRTLRSDVTEDTDTGR